MYTKSELENALLDALSPLTARGGGYLRVLAPYRGELTVSGLMPYALQLPAAFVAYDSSTYAPGPYLCANESVSFSVIALCSAGATPDAFKVMEDVRDILYGSTLGLSVAPLKLVRESALVSAKEINALAALYTLTQNVGIKSQDNGA